MSSTKAQQAPGGGVDESSTFPEKLMTILENDLAPEAIWWLPGDRTFAIHPVKFEAMVLDKYFQKTKFMSFVRKLNQWGFRRIPKQGASDGVMTFVHNMFRKGSPELLQGICDRRKARSQAKGKAKKAGDSEKKDKPIPVTRACLRPPPGMEHTASSQQHHYQNELPSFAPSAPILPSASAASTGTSSNQSAILMAPAGAQMGIPPSVTPPGQGNQQQDLLMAALSCLGQPQMPQVPAPAPMAPQQVPQGMAMNVSVGSPASSSSSCAAAGQGHQHQDLLMAALTCLQQALQQQSPSPAPAPQPTQQLLQQQQPLMQQQMMQQQQPQGTTTTAGSTGMFLPDASTSGGSLDINVALQSLLRMAGLP